MKPYIPALIIVVVIFFFLISWFIWTSSQPSTLAPVPEPGTSTSSVSTASSTSSLPTYTLAQVAQHSTATDCWLAIHGNVYNVTSFIPIHPGGKAILRGCGKDATSLFESVPNHSQYNAEQTVAPQYKIGTLQQ